MEKPTERPIRSTKTSTVFLLLGVLFFCVWLYLPPYYDSFIGDDFLQQWRIREFVDASAGAYKILSPFWTDWYYCPFQNLWFLGNRLLFGLNPFGYYYLQICWHLLAVALIYHLARRLGINAWGALCSALLFAVNSQHQLTVSWISSIAVIMEGVFSLAAAVSFFRFLQKPKQHAWLLVTLGLCVLAMLAHEEWFVLPGFLVIVWLTLKHRPTSRPVDVAAALFLLMLMAGYLVLQFVRPNINLGIGHSFIENTVTAFLPTEISRFVIVALARWSFVDDMCLDDLGNQAIASIFEIILVFGLLCLLFVWLRRSGRAIRLGLLWAGLHLSFVYFALWSQRPELFDGRHLYNAWIGMCLAFGAGVQQLYVNWIARRLPTRSTCGQKALIVVGLLGFTSLQVQRIQLSHAGLHSLARKVQSAEMQLESLLPNVNDKTQVFATRFLLTAPYFDNTAAVWYDQPRLGGGGLDTLKGYDVVTSDFYLFDYADGVLYNLMPELQQHRQTVFLWRRPPTTTGHISDEIAAPLEATAYNLDVIGGPPGDKRLAIQTCPRDGGWTSLGFAATVPQDSQLAFSIWGEPGQAYRVRLLTETGQVRTLFFQTLETGSNKTWQDAMISLGDLAGQTVTVYLELASGDQTGNEPGLWTNPRFVID